MLSLLRYDDSVVKKLPGVKHVLVVKASVFSTQREGVAIVADSFWNAQQARKALKVEWDDSGFEHYSTEQLYAKMNEQLKNQEGISYRTKEEDVDRLLDIGIKMKYM